jgi:hypothetical protein
MMDGSSRDVVVVAAAAAAEMGAQVAALLGQQAEVGRSRVYELSGLLETYGAERPLAAPILPPMFRARNICQFIIL